MTAKEYLSQYRRLDAEINSLCGELSQLRALLYQPSGRIAGQPRGKRRRTAAGYEELVEKIISAEAQINAKIDAAVDVRNEIAATIDAVEDDTYRALLRYRYICCYSWERIAVELNFSWRHIIRLHGYALQQIKMS